MEKQYRLIEGAILSTLVRFALAVFYIILQGIVVWRRRSVTGLCVRCNTVSNRFRHTRISSGANPYVCEAVPLLEHGERKLPQA